MASNSIQPGTGSRHYVNLCQGSLTPQPLHMQICSRENTVSDSEISTSSLASVSASSESSEIRALFPNVCTHNQQSLTNGDHHYNQLKVKAGSKMSEKTQQILYRPHHLESDSSLAESTDSLNTSERKQRKREHYNKLKLNLDSISGNKRAIMGMLTSQIQCIYKSASIHTRVYVLCIVSRSIDFVLLSELYTIN